MVFQETQEVERKIVAILKILSDSPHPLGGRAISHLLSEAGIGLGEGLVLVRCQGHAARRGLLVGYFHEDVAAVHRICELGDQRSDDIRAQGQGGVLIEFDFHRAAIVDQRFGEACRNEDSDFGQLFW